MNRTSHRLAGPAGSVHPAGPARPAGSAHPAGPARPGHLSGRHRPFRPARLARLLTGCAVAAGGLVVLAPPAGAVPPEPIRYVPIRVTATSALDQTTAKSATAVCPAGTRVAGAGIEVSDAGIAVLPTEVRPHRDLTAVTAGALAYGQADWSVTAVAVCARPRPTHERVTNLLTAVTGYTKVARASCPAGTSAIGTGFDITGDPTNVTLSGVVPAPDLGHVTVTATGAVPFGPDWGLEAYAICSSASRVGRITDGGGLAAATAATAATAPAAGVAPLAGAGCPPGSSVNGVGAELLDGNGDPATSGWLTGLAPDAGLDGVTAEADWWYFQGTTTGYGVCVPDSSA